MDAHDHHQKDFLSLFPHEQQQSNDTTLPMFYNPPRAQQQTMPMPNSPAIDILRNMMQMQGLESQAASQATSPAFHSQSLLEQQFKLTQLQQLQQLQNQIFQQQIALISSQAAGMMQSSPSNAIDSGREGSSRSQYSSLPTPSSSAEIHSQPSLDYVSPMILNNNSFQSHDNYSLGVPHLPTPPNYGLPRGSTSAPEQIAFRPMNSHPGLPSGDLDFDISPLASPWLGAAHQTMPSSANKRSASASGDEGSNQPSRKKQSPAIRPVNPNTSKFRGSKSTTSTPLLRSTRSRRESAPGEVTGDTPSPVDLSMPPPAPPGPMPRESSSSSSSSVDGGSSPSFNPQLTPVTPASIMNIGRLGVNHSAFAGGGTPRAIAPLKGDAKKTKAPVAPKTRSTGESASRNKRKTGLTVVSPNLKPILPAGVPLTISTFPSGSSTTGGAVAGTSILTPTSPNFGPTTPTQGLAPIQVRKTSHKAAEQKRRDSLKTTFDELRLLLPPLPLPTDTSLDEQRQSAIPILPGALPPRGPPNKGGEGPNKAVSKLQLLMCGNEYIRVLTGRVERRDEEIGRLRREVTRLRGGMKMEGVEEEGGGEEEELDLERDLDAVEALGGAFGMRTVVGGASGSAAGGSGMLAMGDDEMDDEAAED